MKDPIPLLKEHLASHWFVIANHKMMKIYKADTQFQFHLVSKTMNPMSTGNSKTVLHSENKKNHSEEEHSLQFARIISQFLYKAALEKKFAGLTIAAEPRFLGRLRSAMDPKLKNEVLNWVHKDIEKIPEHDLGSHLLMTSLKQETP